MKKTIDLLLLILLFSTSQLVSIAAPVRTSMPKGYYIVVAAYFASQEKFAENYSAKINTDGQHSKVGFDYARGLHLVYLDYFSDYTESISNMLAVRKQGGFSDAWVRIIKTGGDTKEEVVAKEQSKIEKQTPVVVESKVTEEPKPKPGEIKEPVQEPISYASPIMVSDVPPTQYIPNDAAKPVYLPQTLRNTSVFFSVYNARNGEMLDGEVEVIDTEHSRLISKVKANQYLELPDPKSKSGKITVIGSAFGFRKMQHEINYYNTEADTTKDHVDLIGNFYVVNFDLSHMVKGDIATLYNIYFYNDAAVMVPESKYELNNLLQMMKSNLKYKIRLHGHTNGNGRGKIIYMGPEKNFFAISKDDVVNESGTAKELSGARAQTIKDWLVSQGIEVGRIDTKAWGGTRMLHDKESQHARRNVRVEVEVLEN
jgi:outer membrane protein OmpA-like peptidoglycan-associated protein